VRPAAAIPLALLAAVAVGACGDGDAGESGAGSDKGQMILATTTSTQDSGLLDELVPGFEEESGCSVKTVAVGSGEALELGEKGNADVLLVHSPEAEQEYMDGGHGVSREAVMHNDFIVVGPADDPAGIKGVDSAAEAFTRIAKAEAPFASRADESGTNTKELSLWEAAGIEPKGSWYIETGQGMGETLTIAGQKQAYTLSDRGTFLATDNLDLDLLVEGGKDLLNPYHVIVVKGEGLNRACAQGFSDWIVSPKTQRAIGRFGVAEYGEPLFVADGRADGPDS
jgi:tungstate transport system substrate-binding protein